MHDGSRLSKIGAAVIDLGGIAKGFAVDMAVASLQVQGVEDGIVNAGGDLRVFGPSTHAVTMRHPFLPGAYSAPLELHRLACCSSVSSPKLPTCIDPVAAKPLPCRAAVTVVAPTALWADALTKIALLDGGALSPTVCARYGASVLWSMTATDDASDAGAKQRADIVCG